MTPKQTRRLNKGIIPFIRDWLFPEKTISFPPTSFKMADGIHLTTMQRVKFSDRLRILFGGGIQIVTLIACRTSPTTVVGNSPFNPLPTFSLPKEDKKQTKLPL